MIFQILENNDKLFNIYGSSRLMTYVYRKNALFLKRIPVKLFWSSGFALLAAVKATRADVFLTPRSSVEYKARRFLPFMDA
ncbi:MAG: hypothetical protein VB085_10460 [Peptococcaceae bacterium]|nr:hypothetical protein [Peptococcaceae bacterium]